MRRPSAGFIGVALGVAAFGCGRRDDSFSADALAELAAELTKSVEEYHEELAATSCSLTECRVELAALKGGSEVLSDRETPFDRPVLDGRATVESLQRLRDSLQETIRMQTQRLRELKRRHEKCSQELNSLTTTR